MVKITSIGYSFQISTVIVGVLLWYILSVNLIFIPTKNHHIHISCCFPRSLFVSWEIFNSWIRIIISQPCVSLEFDTYVTRSIKWPVTKNAYPAEKVFGWWHAITISIVCVRMYSNIHSVLSTKDKVKPV